VKEEEREVAGLEERRKNKRACGRGRGWGSVEVLNHSPAARARGADRPACAAAHSPWRRAR